MLNGQRIDPYPLRPHHGMCLAFFIGKGYSDSFTVNMRNMLEVLTDGAYVELHAGPDEICKACPNRIIKKAAAEAAPKESRLPEEAENTAKGEDKEFKCNEAQPGNNNIYACISEEKIIRYDRGVLASCGLKEGDILSFKEFARAVQKNIIETGLREKICAGCGWNEICGSTKSRFAAPPWI